MRGKNPKPLLGIETWSGKEDIATEPGGKNPKPLLGIETSST